MKTLGLNWTIGGNFGWGTYGVELVLHLMRRGGPRPLLLQDPVTYKTDALRTARLALAARSSAASRAGKGPVRIAGEANGLVVAHALGNNAELAFAPEKVSFRAERQVALTFVENTVCSISARRQFAAFPLVVAGSSWCREVVESLGATNAVGCLQGVDPAIFHPAPRRGDFPDRFLIFSGGKLEFRKGQDIVQTAYRAFRSRHPEALLVAVWGNHWARSRGIEQFRHSPHSVAVPMNAAGDAIDWGAWIRANGMMRQDILLITEVQHDHLAVLMRECDVALFPNRAEGGTNLVAMEAMACGVPTILSANTGHLDIIADGACLPLTRQAPVPVDDPYLGTDGWGESDVEEIVEALETVWRDRERARAIGAAGAAQMHRLSWANQIEQLLGLIGMAD